MGVEDTALGRGPELHSVYREMSRLSPQRLVLFLVIHHEMDKGSAA